MFLSLYKKKNCIISSWKCARIAQISFLHQDCNRWNITGKAYGLASVAKELISEHSDRTAFDRIFNKPKSDDRPSIEDKKNDLRQRDEPRGIFKAKHEWNEIKQFCFSCSYDVTRIVFLSTRLSLLIINR